MPGGPSDPPSCTRCGSDRDYYSSGLCRLCHRFAPQPPDACRDCHAWGVTRHSKWLCRGCIAWRARPDRYPVTDCPICRHRRPTKTGGTCRLCWRQRAAERIRRRDKTITAAEANRHGQQLFIALPTRNTGPAVPRSDLHQVPLHPGTVEHRQLVFFEMPHDFTAGIRSTFPEPCDLALADFLDHFTSEWAARHGWSRNPANRARRAMRILLGT